MWTGVILICTGLMLNNCNDSLSPFWIVSEDLCIEKSENALVDTVNALTEEGKTVTSIDYKCIYWDSLEEFTDDPT